MATKTTTIAAAPAAKAHSLHIGLNAVSAAAYEGWDGPLAACEFDAKVMDPDSALAQVGAAGHATALVGTFHPAVVLLSGCQDNQTSMDGEHNGAFTGQLLSVWNHGKFTGNYGSFHARIRAGMPATQSPNLFTLGDASAFLAQVPFSV